MKHFEITFCSHFKNIKKFSFSSETYSKYTAFCIKSGSFAYSFDEGKSEILSENEVIICPPGKSFSRKVVQPVDMYMIKFKSDSAFKFPCKKVTIYDVLRLNYDFDHLKSCVFCKNFDENPEFLHYARDILYMYMDSLSENSEFSNIKSFFQQNFDKDISISELANKTGYSTAHFINKFKKIYGQTPKAYLSGLKILKAKELLFTTNKTSKEIANLCGFNDELYFIRFFKAKTGFTPSQFRKFRI